MEWMLKLIENIDIIIFYFTPGYICIYLFELFRGKSSDENNIIVIKSLVLSYLIQLIYKAIFKVNIVKEITDYIGVVALAVIISYTFYMLIKWGIIDAISKFFKINRSTMPNIFDSCIDIKYGTWITVYMKDDKVIYQGKVRKWESMSSRNDKDIFIVLSNYCSYGYNGEDLNLYEDDNTQWALLNTKNISRIEFTYHPNSKMICDSERVKNTKEKEKCKLKE